MKTELVLWIEFELEELGTGNGRVESSWRGEGSKAGRLIFVKQRLRFLPMLFGILYLSLSPSPSPAKSDLGEKVRCIVC